MIQKLWDDCFSDECALIDSEEERALLKAVIDIHESMRAFLNDEQEAILEKYIDSLCELQSYAAKKAFIKGCEFSASFFIEACVFEK